MAVATETAMVMALVMAAVVSVFAVAAYLAVAVTAFENSKGASVAPKAPRVSLPQECNKYRHKYTEDEWDEETHSYPLNHKWFDCMGVGVR